MALHHYLFIFRLNCVMTKIHFVENFGKLHTTHVHPLFTRKPRTTNGSREWQGSPTPNQ